MNEDTGRFDGENDMRENVVWYLLQSPLLTTGLQQVRSSGLTLEWDNRWPLDRKNFAVAHILGSFASKMTDDYYNRHTPPGIMTFLCTSPEWLTGSANERYTAVAEQNDFLEDQALVCLQACTEGGEPFDHLFTAREVYGVAQGSEMENEIVSIVRQSYQHGYEGMRRYLHSPDWEEEEEEVQVHQLRLAGSDLDDDATAASGTQPALDTGTPSDNQSIIRLLGYIKGKDPRYWDQGIRRGKTLLAGG